SVHCLARPPFPTRRSSDLVNNAVHPRFPRQMDRNIDLDRLGLTGVLQWAPSEQTEVILDAMYAEMGQVQTELALTPISLARTGRSEEHTSELQSRENLVCR